MIFHVAGRADWEAARAAGRYELSTRGLTLAEVGFVHCSLPSQVRGVLDMFYSDADDLVLLQIDPSLLDGVPVRYEDGFPHLYGALPVSAVVAVHPLTRNPDGTFVLPV